MGLAKILLFIFNLIFVILGIILIVSGILIHTSDQSFDVLVFDDIPSAFLSVGTITIVLGIIVFIVAFTGCCGAIKESKFLLTIFIVLLCVILILELAGAIMAYVFKGTVEGEITEGLLASLDQYDPNATEDTEKGRFTQAWDNAQQEFMCCGVRSGKDWHMNGSFPMNEYPDSCCKNQTPDCGETAGEDGIFADGCKISIVGAIAGNLTFSGTICVVILIAEILGIIFACCVIRDVGKGETA